MMKLLLSIILLIFIQSTITLSVSSLKCTNIYTTSELYSFQNYFNFNSDQCVTFITTDTSYSHKWKITFKKVNIPDESGDTIKIYDGFNVNSTLLSTINYNIYDTNNPYIIIGNNSRAITIRSTTNFMLSDADTFSMSLDAEYGDPYVIDISLAVWIIIVIVVVVLITCCLCIYCFCNGFKNAFKDVFGAKSPAVIALVPTYEQQQNQLQYQKIGYIPPNPYANGYTQQNYVPQQNPYAPQPIPNYAPLQNNFAQQNQQPSPAYAPIADKP